MTDTGFVKIPVHKDVLAELGDNWDPVLNVAREAAAAEGGRLIDENHPATKAEGDTFVMEWEMERIPA